MRVKRDKTGEVYYRLLVINEAPSKREPSGKLVPRVMVRCECGVEKEVDYKSLRKGRIKSCGCLNDEAKIKIKSGDTYGLWVVIEETEGYYNKGEKEDRQFLCRCSCGKTRNVNLQSLRNGSSKSCGCKGVVKKIKEKVPPQDTENERWVESYSFKGYYVSSLGRIYKLKTQRHINTKLANSFKIRDKQILKEIELYLSFIGKYDKDKYVVKCTGEHMSLDKIELVLKNADNINKLKSKYYNMKFRCYNEKSKDYKNYGGRGIKICDEWLLDLNAFIEWGISNGFGVAEGTEIDRKNNDGDYSPLNCRFVTKTENTRNSRGTKMTKEDVIRIRFGDLKDLPTKAVADILNVHPNSIRDVILYKTFKELF